MLLSPSGNSLWPDVFAGLEIVEALSQRGVVVVRIFSGRELRGPSVVLPAEPIALAKQSNGFGQKFVLIGIAAAR